LIAAARLAAITPVLVLPSNLNSHRQPLASVNWTMEYSTPLYSIRSPSRHNIAKAETARLRSDKNTNRVLGMFTCALNQSTALKKIRLQISLELFVKQAVLLFSPMADWERFLRTQSQTSRLV
jgi:hypothetical protein